MLLTSLVFYLFLTLERIETGLKEKHLPSPQIYIVYTGILCLAFFPCLINLIFYV